ncbi:MAG: hypothetical protein V3T28_09720 [Gemmatimonadales bacterium]
MMQNPEIENRVVLCVSRSDGRRIANPEPRARAVTTQALACPHHHAGVEIESVNVRRTEELKDQLRTYATPATELQCHATGQRTAHPEKFRRFDVPLNSRSNGVVHERVLEAV